MSQEARGLDAGPRLVDRLVGWGDHRSAAIVARIGQEEKAHVAVGMPPPPFPGDALVAFSLRSQHHSNFRIIKAVALLFSLAKTAWVLSKVLWHEDGLEHLHTDCSVLWLHACRTAVLASPAQFKLAQLCHQSSSLAYVGLPSLLPKSILGPLPCPSFRYLPLYRLYIYTIAPFLLLSYSRDSMGHHHAACSHQSCQKFSSPRQGMILSCCSVRKTGI